jgi:hypothetical protein
MNSEYDYFNTKHIKITGYSWNNTTNSIEEKVVYDSDISDDLSNPIIIKTNDGTKEFANIIVYNIPKDIVSKDINEDSSVKAKYEFYNNSVKDKFTTIKFKSTPFDPSHLYYIINITYRPYLFAQTSTETIEYVESSADRTYNVGLVIPYNAMEDSFKNG